MVVRRTCFSHRDPEVQRILNSESGAFLIVLSILLVTLLTVFALAVDSARMYISSLKVQQAVDAATLVGVRNQATLSKQDVEALAVQVTQENLLQNGYQLPNISVNAILDEATDTLRVTASHNIESLFFGKMLRGRRWHETPAVASAQNRQVAVMLVVDRTGSMGTLVRLSNGRYQTRMELVRDASLRFADYFDSADRVGVVSFSTDTEVNYDITQPFSPAAFNQMVNSFPLPRGATNIQIGVLRGLQELLKLGEEWDLNMVILTDGNPNRNARDDNQEVALIDWAENLFGEDIDVPNDPRCRPRRNNREQRENFIAAQLATNLARQAGVRVFSIAFGSEENTTATTNRPWGTIDPTGVRSGILESFIRWLANDVDAARYNHDHEFFSECVPSYAEMGQIGEVGTGLISSDAADVEAMLAQVGFSIGTKLIE